MGDIRKNCWCFLDERSVPKSVWAVCTKCEEQRLAREDYWIKLVPTNQFNTLDDLINEINQTGPLILRCNQGIHDITVERYWFARKGMEEPDL